MKRKSGNPRIPKVNPEVDFITLMQYGVGVYCTECKVEVPYHSTKNTKGVERHMKNFHASMVTSFLERKEQELKRKGAINNYFPNKVPKKNKMASRANIEKFHRMLAVWTATALRPFSIVEDVELQEIISFATHVNGELKLPSRNTNRKNVLGESKRVKELVRSDIEKNCSMFAATTDMWSSRNMKAFMALTVHFLTQAFEMRNYTLEVKPVIGKHTAHMIRSELEECFYKWGLSSVDLSMMLRDSGSNI